MTVLITSAKSRTGQFVAMQLGNAGLDLRLTDVNGGDGVTACDLNHDEAADELVSGIDAIVHIGYEGQMLDDPSQMIDYHTRCTYNLLWAAAEAGVSRVINLSTLKLMEAYEENLVVTENWRSRPPGGDIGLLCAHLCEVVCKEFARDQMLVVANLRLGWPILNGGRDSARESGGDSVLCSIDLGNAVSSALTADLEQWQDIHVQTPVPRQRYLTAKAESVLGFA